MLTSAQYTALAAAIRADTDQAVIDALAIRNDVLLAELYNADTTFIVWRTNVTPDEYREAIVWTEVDALTSGSKYRIWEWLTMNMTAPINASSANVRQGLADCWASNTTTRPQLLAIAKRAATKAEKVFATGTGTDVTPGLLVWEGRLSHSDISTALNNNPV
jgi:hypothetical protein